MTEITNDSLSLYRCVHCECVTILKIGDAQCECKCGAEFYPMSRNVTLGEPMTMNTIAGEALQGLWPTAEASASTDEGNWTAEGTVSNSSDKYLQIVDVVEDLIRHSAYDLIAGQAGKVARLIVSNLAHKHGMQPVRDR